MAQAWEPNPIGPPSRARNRVVHGKWNRVAGTEFRNEIVSLRKPSGEMESTSISRVQQNK